MNIALLLSLSLLTQADGADFDTRVIPILTKAGCNTAACHGSAAGRGGFKLSLYGGNPAADFDAIVRQYEGRRVNLSDPPRSLLLAKPTGEMEHGGKIRLEAGGEFAEVIEAWIRSGAVRAKSSPSLLRLEVTPAKSHVERIPAAIHLQATAIFAGGQRQDVGDLAVYTAEDEAAIEVGSAGEVTINRRGRHNVLVRFLTEVVAVTVTAPLGEEPVDLAIAPRRNFIDDEILATLEELRLPPSPPADAHTMLRRLRLDLTGRLPSPGEIADWKVASESAIRNSQSAIEVLVDDLVASNDFTEYWTHRLDEWLRVGTAGSDETAAQAFHLWLRNRLASGKPLNETAVALITADGDTLEYGAANFYRAAPDARGQAEYFSEVLMGVRLRCANCHNHPLDHWTQDDYHGLAALFAPLERGRTVRFIGRGEVSHPATGEAAVPKLPGGEFLSPQGDHRAALADWLTAKENPFFARAMVNRLWQAMMGRGLVEPVDDFRATNPPTHPQLLDQLAEDFIAHNYDLRHTLRTIATSAAYSRSSQPLRANEADDRFYSHAIRKPLSAEVLLDAIVDVTDGADRGGKDHMRAIALVGPSAQSPELDLLGRCSRESSCASGGAAGGVPRQLALLNGELLNDKLQSQRGRIAQLHAGEQDNDAIVRQLYLLALSRPPTKKEAGHWRKQLDAVSVEERRRQLEDFAWSLLNCDEFAKRY